MKAKASVIAQKLLNLYRQAHIIDGGWAAVNQVFVSEATQDVLSELHDLPTGKMLVTHISNLRDGTTPMDSISRELLPYGGMMATAMESVILSPDEISEILSAINSFSPDENGLTVFMQTPSIRQFGAKWPTIIRNAISNNPDATARLDNIINIWNARNMWASANNIVNQPINDRTRAQLQVDMPEYETYLPMFGDAGRDLLKRLRELTSSMPKTDDTVTLPQDD